MQQENFAPPIKLSIDRLFLVVGISLVLAVSQFFTLIAPFPLSLGVIMFGRTKGYSLMGACLLLLLAYASVDVVGLTYFTSYAIVSVIAVAITETILRKVSPMKGVFRAGLALLGVAALITSFSLATSEFSIKKNVVELIKQNKQMLSKEQVEAIKQSGNDWSLVFLENPEKFADRVMDELPIFICVGVFFTLWANMLLVLRSRKMFIPRTVYPFSDHHLIRFKVPEQAIWGVIVSLILVVFGADLGGRWTEVAGFTMLYTFGVFYFFQGFGLYLDLLTMMKIVGFIRFFLVGITLVTASKLLAALGLFDMFFNFRKRMFKKNKEDSES